MERSQAIAGVLERFASAISAGDLSVLDDLVYDGEETVFVGSDPAEWFYGSAGMKVVKQQFSEMAGITFALVEPVAYEHGDAGWVASKIHMVIPDAGESDGRMTMVLVRMNGAWKIVQGHFSFGVDNEVAIGQELTLPE